MELELRHLRTLRAVAEVGSLNRGAARLGIPQPALSRQVRRLEEILHGPLFYRDIRGVRPTPRCEELLGYIDGVVYAFEVLENDLSRYRAMSRRALRVGWATSSLSGALLRCLKRLNVPQETEIVVASSAHQLDELLRSGSLDLAVTAENRDVVPNYGQLVGLVPIAAEPALVAVPQDHILATEPAVHMRDLENEKWITSSGPDGCHEFLYRVCGRHGFVPELAHDVPITGPREDVVRNQRCVSLVQAVRARAPGVVRKPVRDLNLLTRHALAFRKDAPIATELPALVALLAKEHDVAMGGVVAGGAPSGASWSVLGRDLSRGGSGCRGATQPGGRS